METSTAIAILSRWIHVGAAIVLLGGSVFMRYVLMPSAKSLPDDQHEALRANLRGRWKKFVHIGIGLLLLSGFYNYLVVGIDKADESKLYHPLIGTKILLAIGVFFIAEALVGKSSAFEKMRAKPAMWMTLLIILAALVSALAGVVKVLI